MADKAKESPNTAYSREHDTVLRYKTIIEEEKLDTQQLKDAIADLCKHYEGLLDDTKLLTSLGDRLQRKLKGANQKLDMQKKEIEQMNQSLQEKNVELQLTLDELTKSKASRKAQGLIFLAAVVLFVFSETIEGFLDSTFNSQWISLIAKVGLVVLLKPFESYLEGYFTRQAMSKDKRELLKKYMSAPIAKE